MRALIRLSLIIFLFAFSSSCGYYSFKGALPSHIKSIAIPQFNDNSGYPDIREKVTDALIEAFVEDNTLVVVDDSKADLVITGTVQSIRKNALAVKPGETVAEYNLNVTLEVTCEDVRTSKKLYDKSFIKHGVLSGTGGQQEVDQAIDDALGLLTEDILNTTLGGW